MNATTKATANRAIPAQARPEIVSVVGTGAMGSQIACLCAISGFQVRLAGRSPERLESSAGVIEQLINRKVEKGAYSAEQAAEMLGAVSYSDDLATAVADASMIIESVAEDRDIKSRVLQKISKHAKEDAVIGTNSSTIGSSTFVGDVSNPTRLLNIHFYNPPLLMALVEVVRGEHTDDAAVTADWTSREVWARRGHRAQRQLSGFWPIACSFPRLPRACVWSKTATSARRSAIWPCATRWDGPWAPSRLATWWGWTSSRIFSKKCPPDRR